MSPAAGLLISLLLPYLPLRHLSRIPRALLPSSSKLRGQGLFLLLITLLSIGPLVALDFLVFHGSRGAITKVDGVQLSASMLESMGIPNIIYRSQRYSEWHLFYLRRAVRHSNEHLTTLCTPVRVMAIVPWLGVLFNIIALPFVFYSASHWSEGLATAVSSTPSISSAEVAEIIRASRAIDEKVPSFV